MDTDRISIINQDQSESAAVSATATTGFTVIKAEKGSAEAVFIPAGNTAAIYENFGYTSADYPALQEVIDFNASHGLYVSAPYDTTTSKVPVAYVTPAGIFSRATPVTLTAQRIEDIELEEASIEGISTISAAQDILIPIGKEMSYFNAGIADVAEPITYAAGDTKVLSFNFGFDASPADGAFSAPNSSAFHFLNDTAFNGAEPGRVMKRPAGGAIGILTVDIPTASAALDLYLTISSADILISDNAGHDIGKAVAVGGNIYAMTIDSAYARGAIAGEYATYFSANAIATTWASETFRAAVKAYWKATLNQTAIYATVYQKYLSERATYFSFPKQQLGNTISFTVSEKVTPTSSASRTITGSLVEEAVDGFGSTIGFKTKLAGQPFVNIVTLKPFDGSTVFTATLTSVGPTITPAPLKLYRGDRTVADASLELGWAEAQSSDYDGVEVFFNPISLTNNVTLFTQLANTHSLSRFVGSRTVTPEQAIDGLAALSYGANYFISTNLFVRKSSFTKEDFASNLVGAYAGMIAKCIDVRYGGIAPMYLNQNGVGGQLQGISVKKAVHKYTKEQLTVLDEANYNPIVRDAAHGIMLTSQKTAKAGETSDWSFIGHTSAFLKLQRSIRDLAMIPQIGKPNNPYYRELRAQQVLTMLRPRIEGLGRIWASGSVDTEAINTADILAQRKFVIGVTVRVDIFSEGVELIFTNVGQTTVLE